MNENNGSAIGSTIGALVLAAVCAAGGWIGCGMWMRAAKAKAGNPAVMAAMAAAGGGVTVAVTNAEMRAYNLPERFVAHAEAVRCRRSTCCRRSTAT